jgi:hypothetical protein
MGMLRQTLDTEKLGANEILAFLIGKEGRSLDGAKA